MKRKEKESFEEKAAREQRAINWFQFEKELQGIYLHQEPIEDKYAPIDNWMISGATESVVEIKVRTDYSSTQIDRMGGAYLEFNKLEGIRQHLEQKNALSLPVYYFCFFKDCLKIYELDMDPTMYSWRLESLQKNDFNKSYKINKFVAPLSNPVETFFYKNKQK